MKTITWLSIGILACVWMISGCEREPPYEKPLKPVRVQAVKSYQPNSGIRYSATINPYTQVNLSFKVGGYIREILQTRGADGRMRDVQEGDWIEKNITVAWVRENDYVEKVNQAKAQLAAQLAQLKKARLDFGRAKDLYATQSLTKPDYDSAVQELGVAKAQVKGARAQLGEAELNLQYCALNATMDGVILSRKIEVGTLVSPGTVGFALSDVSSVKVVFGVPGLMLDTTKLGDPQTIRTKSIPDKEFRGRITAISPAADPKNRVFEVEITVPNPQNQLRPGMIASLRVARPRKPEPVALVPLTAIVQSKTDPAGYALFVLEDKDNKQVAHIRNVKLGNVYGNLIAVREGAKIGEPVIATGATMVVDGENVRVIP
ncbi:MAG: efflux RND transporter periplasmic adaptor subunit [bacterium]|nr:efflux RND transporter periplasmic adaptor subunit [bacterium]